MTATNKPIAVSTTQYALAVRRSIKMAGEREPKGSNGDTPAEGLYTNRTTAETPAP